MPTRDEWRAVVGPKLTDEELDELIADIRRIISVYLDHYLEQVRQQERCSPKE